MFAWHQFHAGEADRTAVMHHVAHLNERRPPIDGVETKAEEVGEPFTLQQFGGLRLFLAVLVNQAEILLQDLALALCYTAGEVRIEDTIGVNVIKPGTVRAFVVDSHLMGGAPVGHVLFSQGVGLLLEHCGDLYPLFGAQGA